MTNTGTRSDAPRRMKRMAVACALVLMVTGHGTPGGELAAAQAQDATPAPSTYGNFYAGGSYDKAHPARHMIGQMYVQFQIPAQLRHPLPIVLIHGGDQTGAGWFSTPDGRPGWAQYFVRLGYGVYVVDQVARGRSAFVPEVYGATSGQPLDYVMQKFTSQERYKLWPQAALHTQWPGRGEPGDPAFDQYASSEAQGMENRALQTQMNVDALAALLDRIGASVILVHSQSGAYAWPLAQARPALVKAIVAVEPAGPPVHDVVVHSAQRFDVGWDNAIKQTEDDYYRDNPGVKPYGLTSIPLQYAPAVTPQSPLSFVQQEKPERRDLARCWRQQEPARKLVAVGERPIMVLEAEASFYAGYNHCNVEYLRQAGVDATFIKLAELGIHGNGHMMMLEKNSDQVAQVIADWLEKVLGPIEAAQRSAH
ncbi:MAG TPA: alpha/beta hydrolase [Xanthobacteraceae bacterium]